MEKQPSTTSKKIAQNQPFHIFQNATYVTDGGLESFLIFHRGIELNHFAAFELLNDEQGREELRDYFLPYLDLAAKYNYHFVAETPHVARQSRLGV